MVFLTPMPERRFPLFRAHLAHLLPDGTATRDHHLYEIADATTSDVVGTLWFTAQDGDTGRAAWVYDVEIFAPFRRKGYAAKSLEAAEGRAAEPGATGLGLHVFGHNAAARALYEAAGYSPTSIVLSRRIDRR